MTIGARWGGRIHPSRIHRARVTLERGVERARWMRAVERVISRAA